MPIKVLIIIPTLDLGGAEIDLLRNLPRLDRDKVKVVVCTFQRKGILTNELIDAGIEVVDVSRTANNLASVLSGGKLVSHLNFLSSAARLAVKGARYIRMARSTAALIRRHQFDVVHAILPGAHFLGVLANMLAGWRPLVMSRVSLNFYHKDDWLFRNVERHLLHRRTELAIGNSKAILCELREEGFPDDRLILIRNGIDSPAFTREMTGRREARARLGVSSSALVFSSVANLFPYKGHADLLVALNMLRDQMPSDWVLLIAGGDRQGNLARLRALAGELSLSEHVRLLGERRDVPTLLSAADIHVSASHHEGLPNNILEAMCAGLPVVATAVGGVPELVADGITGILVPPRDLGALAGALRALAGDASRRALLGKAGRLRAEQHFPIERSVTSLTQVYLQAASLSMPARKSTPPAYP